LTNDASPSPAARRLATVAACIGWATLALQLYLSIALAVTADRSVAWGLFMYLGFFTVLTNLLVALALSAAASGAAGPFWRFLRRPGVVTAIAAAIAMVGLIYHFVLRLIWDPQGLLWLADVLLHYVMPMLFLVYWWIAVPARGLRWRYIPVWWSWPLIYLAYVLLRGALAGVYPYPFIDAGNLGYARTAINAVGMLAAFTLIAALLVAIGRVKPMPEKV
jgi:hypothetical protein